MTSQKVLSTSVAKVLNEPKILILDIETAPILGNVWSLWKQNVGLNQIEKDWYILSFAAKWLGEKTVHYFDSSQSDNIENDGPLLMFLRGLLDNADIVIAHNGRRFDLPKINTRFVMAGLKPPSPYRVIDTLDIAKKHFCFTSNKLAYISSVLVPEDQKSEHKNFPGFDLWKEVIRGNQEAWAEMREYNIQDVNTLEKVYLKLRPYAATHPNIGVFSDDEIGKETRRCSKCGSEHIVKRGSYYTQVSQYQRYRCNDCGGWSRERFTLKPTRQNKILLTGV